MPAGKAGGFLALDWQDGSPTGALSRRSFALHEQLSKDLPEDTGYRRVATLSVSATAKAGGPSDQPAPGATILRAALNVPWGVSCIVSCQLQHWLGIDFELRSFCKDFKASVT